MKRAIQALRIHLVVVRAQAKEQGATKAARERSRAAEREILDAIDVLERHGKGEK